MICTTCLQALPELLLHLHPLHSFPRLLPRLPHLCPLLLLRLLLFGPLLLFHLHHRIHLRPLLIFLRALAVFRLY